MIKNNIPNFITCLNLLCGCVGIVFAFEGNLVWSAYMVGVAAVFDFLDGFAARILKVHSEIGKQLDSMADMVSFGVLPGVVMYHLIYNSINISVPFQGYTTIKSWGPYMENSSFGLFGPYIPYAGFLITIFSAIRLAKFNVDTRQTNSFIGLPTPANSILVCSFPLILFYQCSGYVIDINTGIMSSASSTFKLIMNPYFLLFITVAFSLLLVAPLPLFALKFKNFGWADNKIRYIFLIICLLLLVCLQFVAIPIIILLYILFSVVNNLTTKTKELKNK